MGTGTSKARELALFAAGALLAASAVIARYELRAQPEPVSAVAGLTARAAAGAGAVEQETTRPEQQAAPSAEAPPSSGLPASGLGGADGQGSARAEQLRGKLADVLREKRDLEAQLQTVEGELERRANLPRSGDPRDYELSAEDWKALAAEGRIKYRIPCDLRHKASYGNMAGALDQLGLSPEEGEVLTELHQRSNARVWATLRPLCIDVMGKAELADLLGSSRCLSLIQEVYTDKDWKAALAARRRVAEVHAGIAQPPAAGDPPDPIFAALFAVTSEGKRFHADLVESFGAEEARRLNDNLTCVATAG